MSDLECFEARMHSVDLGDGTSVEFPLFYTKRGDYIGDKDMADFLAERGIELVRVLEVLQRLDARKELRLENLSEAQMKAGLGFVRIR